MVAASAAIGPAGVVRLCQLSTVTYNPLRELHELSLARNRLCAVAAATLADALSAGALPRLSTLRLEDNAIGTDGLAALAVAIGEAAGTARLRWISASKNGISDASPLARALRPHHTHVFLEGNELDDTSAVAFAHAIRFGAMAEGRRLWLYGNPKITAASRDALETVCAEKFLHRDFLLS